MVDEATFTKALDKWLAEVREESIRLFRDDVAAESCMNVARQIVEARDVKRAQRRVELLQNVRIPSPLKTN